MTGDIEKIVTDLACCLAATNRKVVFAESCTGGLVAAALSHVPGISAWLCGSAVVYREETKACWLGVAREDLARYSAVSPQVAQQMAMGVLLRTPEADLAASITGHLGPGAPPALDGVVFVAVAKRGPSGTGLVGCWRHLLAAQDRLGRQEEAAIRVMTHCRDIACGKGAD